MKKQMALLLSVLLLSACGGEESSSSNNSASNSQTDHQQADNQNDQQNNQTNDQNASENEQTQAEQPALPVTDAQAVRFLNQATFGANQASIDQVKSLGLTEWIKQQMQHPVSTSHYELTNTIATSRQRAGYPAENPNFPNPSSTGQVKDDQESAWWQNSVFGEDQLRQRVAFALSELLVVSSAEPPLDRHTESLAAFYDLLVDHAFGNYRDLIEVVSKSPTMGVYLSHQGNRKGDPVTGRTPDENYARELMQLFTIGLYNTFENGEAKTDSEGNLIPSYEQTDVENLAKVMTGWTRKLVYTHDRFKGAQRSPGGYNEPMECIDGYHDFDSKQLLGQTIPANLSCEEDLDQALDIIFAHDNLAPLVSKHLIMRLVTSNPSAAYVGRVAAVFNDNGAGIKGDLAAVVKAILLDEEARNDTVESTFGLIKSPIISTTQLLRAFNPIQPKGYPKMVGEIITPLRSASVFNFYLPDYQPSQAAFLQKNLVSPEASLFTDLGSANHHNHLYQLITVREVREKVYKDENHREPADGLFTEIVDNSGNEIHLDLKTELALIKDTLDGDYENIQQSENKDLVLDKLVSHLNLIMTANQLTETQQNLIKDYLLGVRSSKAEWHCILLAQEAVLMIATSSSFAIQR